MHIKSILIFILLIVFLLIYLNQYYSSIDITLPFNYLLSIIPSFNTINNKENDNKQDDNKNNKQNENKQDDTIQNENKQDDTAQNENKQDDTKKDDTKNNKFHNDRESNPYLTSDIISKTTTHQPSSNKLVFNSQPITTTYKPVSESRSNKLVFNSQQPISTNKNIINEYLQKGCKIRESFNTLGDNSRNVWVYWENMNRNSYPTYINLCLNIMKSQFSEYNLVILDEETIKLYLPNLRDDFDNLLVAQKTDYYRIALLYYYGGIWIDADIIVMNNFDNIFEKLDSGYDFVGFGCTGLQCTNGYGYPSNWVLASQKNGILVKNCLDILNYKLDNRSNEIYQNENTYHDYGKVIIWNVLEDLISKGYNYYHFTSDHDGARDINGEWIHSPNFFNTIPTEFLDESKLMFVVLYNSEIANNEEYNWILDCDEERIIYGNEWICSLFRKALNFE